MDSHHSLFLAHRETFSSRIYHLLRLDHSAASTLQYLPDKFYTFLHSNPSNKHHETARTRQESRQVQDIYYRYNNYDKVLSSISKMMLEPPFENTAH